MGKSPTDEEIEKLKEHLNINNFKKNDAVNNSNIVLSNDKESFIRKGEVGNWKKYLTREMSERVDQLIKEKFDPVGLKFEC